MVRKSIKISCSAADVLSLTEISDFQGELKSITSANLQKLKNRLVKSFDVPFFVWKNKEGNWILDGHQRHKALRELEREGWTIPPLPVVYIEAKDIKDARQKLLGISSQYGQFVLDELENWTVELDKDILSSLNFNDKKLDKLFEEEEQAEGTKQPEVSDAVVEEDILKHDRFYFSFSGGKDSALALFKMVPVLKRESKQFEVLYVDTGVEFPDLLEYIYNITEQLDVSLQVLKARRNFFDVYYRKKIWPDSIFRDCIESLINENLDRYCTEIKEPYVLIRGGRSDQKTNRSNSQKIQHVKSKPLQTIYNPLYDLTKEQYAKELESIPLWAGYAKGFDRTACWCCPFQKKTQWEAMKLYYPLLYERLQIMFKTMKWKEHEGCGNLKNVRRYWGDIKTC